jgi:hypothetical protein
MKNLKLNRLLLMAGLALCLVLVAFVAVKTADAQVTGPLINAKGLDRPANLNDIWEKTSALDARIIAMEERLNRIQLGVDETYKEVLRLKKALSK